MIAVASARPPARIGLDHVPLFSANYVAAVPSHALCVQGARARMRAHSETSYAAQS